MTVLSGCRMGQFVYFTTRYDRAYRTSLPQNALEIEYRAAAGRQVAFYLAPRLEPAQPPERLWVMFGGNAAVALGWLELAQAVPDPQAGFLLLDYPGYGLCEGYPNQAKIADSADKALAALAVRLGTAPDALNRHLRVIGHSLGSATALEFATRHHVERIVLMAPFTNMIEIAQWMVGWPLCHLVPERYDNVASLNKLRVSRPRPVVTILHGDADLIVPVAMGRSLARRYPDWIDYREIPGGTHHSLLDGDLRHVLQAMAPAPSSFPRLARTVESGAPGLP